jgi:hypothetical protein
VRHADAGYAKAIEVAKAKVLKLPTVPMSCRAQSAKGVLQQAAPLGFCMLTTSMLQRQ